jgi:hypothetical protein
VRLHLHILIPRCVAALNLLQVCILIAGCTTPRPLDSQSLSAASADPRWNTLLTAYASAISAAGKDSATIWHHNWLGNATVRNQGPPHQGLCWQWRDHLDTTLAPTIQSLHFSAVGIHANRGSRMEHNALLVYNPAAITLAHLLAAPTPTSSAPPVALVLDPWFSGTAAVYSVSEWSRLAAASHPVGFDLRPYPVGNIEKSAPRDPLHE